VNCELLGLSPAAGCRLQCCHTAAAVYDGCGCVLLLRPAVWSPAPAVSICLYPRPRSRPPPPPPLPLWQGQGKAPSGAKRRQAAPSGAKRRQAAPSATKAQGASCCQLLRSRVGVVFNPTLRWFYMYICFLNPLSLTRVHEIPTAFAQALRRSLVQLYRRPCW
jgi:hypothetical protein